MAIDQKHMRIERLRLSTNAVTKCIGIFLLIKKKEMKKL